MNNWNNPNAKIYPMIPCLEGEIWADLTDRAAPGIKPYYSISNYGRIYNGFSGLILSPSIDSKGYWFYRLRCNFIKNGARNYRVHRMIMLTFHYIEGCENMEIDHINGDKKDFRECNLRWCTHSLNGLYSYQNGRTNPKGENRVNSTITDKQAEEICERIESGENMKNIAKDYNVKPDLIYSIANHRAWNHISKDFDFSKRNGKNGKGIIK